MKIVTLLVLITILSIRILSAQEVENSTEDFQKTYTYALADNIEEMIDFLDSFPESKLSSNQSEVRQILLKRFKDKDYSDLPRTSSKEINVLLEAMYEYWLVRYLNEKDAEVADAELVQKVASYIYEAEYKDQGISFSSITDSVRYYTNSFINDRGYYANAMGFTSGIYDIFIWKRNRTKEYTIPLFHDTATVKVHFMQEEITKGRLAFSTNNYYHAAGWATDSVLYAFENAYHENDPSFQINYLFHEGQHFLDYEKFPSLTSHDLEYRAKLIELIYSEETFMRVLKHFVINAEYELDNIHGFANWKVISDLSHELFEKEFEDSLEEWEGINSAKIKEVSRELFDIHTIELEKQGAETVESIITITK